MRPTKLVDPNNESGIMALSPSRRSADRNWSRKIKPVPRTTKGGRRPGPTGSFGQRPSRKTQSRRDKRSTQPVKTSGCVVDILVDVAGREHDRSYKSSGTLIRKASRQLPASMSHPPRNRSDRARSGSGRCPYADRAAFRLLRRNVWPSIARRFGISIAALAPCTKRASSNRIRVGATAQAREAMPNSRTPAIKRRRRPYRSPAAPPSKRSALKGSK